MGMKTACAQCRNTTTAMSASTTIALLRTMTDMCETVGAVTMGTSSAFAGDSEDVAVGFQRTMASAAMLDHDWTAPVAGGTVASGAWGRARSLGFSSSKGRASCRRFALLLGHDPVVHELP